jgi:hypothetical protein
VSDVDIAILKRAKTLSEAKRYAEAYKLLETTDHPTAAQWRDKIESMRFTVVDNPKRRSGLPLPAIVGLVIVGVLIIAGVIAGVSISNNNANATATQEAADRLTQRLVGYCQQVVAIETVNDFIEYDIPTDANPRAALSDCIRFPAAAIQVFPNRLQECDASSGSDVEFFQCVEALEMSTSDYDGLSAWADFLGLCPTDLEAREYLDCAERIDAAIVQHADLYKECFYTVRDTPGIDIEVCWGNRGILPLEVALSATNEADKP